MEEKLQEMGDQLTGDLMSYIFGDRFDNTDDITEDEEMNKAWEYINEKTCGMLWAAYDEGFNDAHEKNEEDY